MQAYEELLPQFGPFIRAFNDEALNTLVSALNVPGALSSGAFPSYPNGFKTQVFPFQVGDQVLQVDVPSMINGTDLSKSIIMRDFASDPNYLAGLIIMRADVGVINSDVSFSVKLPGTGSLVRTNAWQSGTPPFSQDYFIWNAATVPVNLIGNISGYIIMSQIIP